MTFVRGQFLLLASGALAESFVPGLERKSALQCCDLLGPWAFQYSQGEYQMLTRSSRNGLAYNDVNFNAMSFGEPKRKRRVTVVDNKSPPNDNSWREIGWVSKTPPQNSRDPEQATTSPRQQAQWGYKNDSRTDQARMISTTPTRITTKTSKTSMGFLSEQPTQDTARVGKLCWKCKGATRPVAAGVGWMIGPPAEETTTGNSTSGNSTTRGTVDCAHGVCEKCQEIV